MAISRVPGYSLLANLDRQGTDLSLTSSGLTLQYWDVVNYRVGINTSNPQQALEVNGNILAGNGHVYTSANISFDLGTSTNWWRTIYAENIQSTNLTGRLLTNAQSNITSLGTITNLTTTGNTYVVGNLTINGNLIVGNITSSGLTGNITGNLTGYVLQGLQPYITTLGNITVANITILGNILNLAGNLSVSTINADNIFQGGAQLLDTNSNIQVSGDVVGSGVYNNINLQLTTTGVIVGTYGSGSQVAQFFVNDEGRMVSAANVTIDQVGNLTFSNTTISSNTELTLLTNTNGNIYLNAGSTGIVQIVGNDAFGLPAGPNGDRPLNPAVGYIRFNTTNDILEYWDGNIWNSPGLSTMSSEVINPTGVDTTYTLTGNSTSDGVLVSINGTIQQPITAYEVLGDQITFSEIPLVSDIIEIRKVASGIVTVESLHYGDADITLDLANVNVTGNILPSANVTYSLGSANYQWKDLWVSGNTIYIGGSAITVANGQLSLSGNVIGAAAPFGNVNVKAYADTMAYTNYSNVNVKAYADTMAYTNYSNVNVAAYISTNSSSITTLGTIVSGTWNASTIGVVYGGTGATVTSGVGGALDNLLPSGEQTGYVLATSGAGSYFWTSPSAGGATVGQQLTTQRQANAIVANTTVINLAGISYTPGAGQLRVYINGVRQFPAAYTETSNVSYTLSANVAAGDSVFTEIDQFSSFNNYANLTYASNIGNIAAVGLTVQSAINSLEITKATLASPVFTGVTTIGGNLVVNGNLFINGNLTTINSNNLTINDSLIYLADDNPADTLDIGVVSAFTDAVRYQHTGFARDANDGVWKLFANVVPEPTTTIDFTNATYSNLLVGNLQTTGVNATGNVQGSIGSFGTVTTTGNVTVSGNITVTGNIVANKNIVVGGSAGTNGQVLRSTGTGATWANPFTWNVATVGTTVASNATGSYTIPANAIMAMGTNLHSMGSNSGSRVSVNVKNSSGTTLFTYDLTGGNEFNGGDGGSGLFVRSAWSVAIPAAAAGGTLEFFRSGGSNNSWSVTVNQVILSA